MTYPSDNPEDISPSEAYRRRSLALLDLLSKTLPPHLFEQVAGLSYPSRLAMHKFRDKESKRLEDWFDEDHATDSRIQELATLLNSQSPDRQAAVTWFDEHKEALTIDMLMQLVSGTRLQALSDHMRSKRASVMASTSKQRKVIGWRWLQYEAGLVIREGVPKGKKLSKNEATPHLATDFNLAPKTIREKYLTNIELDKSVFPDGIEEARKEVWLNGPVSDFVYRR